MPENDQPTLFTIPVKWECWCHAPYQECEHYEMCSNCRSRGQYFPKGKDSSQLGPLGRRLLQERAELTNKDQAAYNVKWGNR